MCNFDVSFFAYRVTQSVYISNLEYIIECNYQNMFRIILFLFLLINYIKRTTYYYVQNATSWSNAQFYCLSNYHSNLATISSSSDNNDACTACQVYFFFI